LQTGEPAQVIQVRVEHLRVDERDFCHVVKHPHSIFADQIAKPRWADERLPNIATQLFGRLDRGQLPVTANAHPHKAQSENRQQAQKEP
jgi:hypothetical protein